MNEIKEEKMDEKDKKKQKVNKFFFYWMNK
jgi:hypothetical protein